MTGGVVGHAGGTDEAISTLLFVAAGILGWIGVSRLQGRGYDRVPKLGAWIAAGLAPICLVAAVAVPFLLRPGGARPATDATLTIVSPSPGQVIENSGGAVDVRVDLQGATLAPISSTDLSSNQGHVHLYIDDRLVSMTDGLEQRVEVAPGPHTVRVDFVANDHGPFVPPVGHTVEFEVRH